MFAIIEALGAAFSLSVIAAGTTLLASGVWIVDLFYNIFH